MGTVYANGMEISAKKDVNKSICAMPDVCLSPPSPPAGPLPIPYPNTSDASKTSDGSKSVKIGGQEVGLKNESSYKSSNGDEAATRGLGMGVVTHTIQGKTKHAAWSFNVKIEGANAIRNMDLTTHNHINQPNMALVVNQASQNVPVDRPLTCDELQAANAIVQQDQMRPSRQNRGFTSTTASFTPPSGAGSMFMKAVTPQDLIRSGARSGFAQPRPPNQTMSCSNVQWGAAGNNNHTEPKLMEQFFPAPKPVGTLTMSIHHQPLGPPGPTGRGPSPPPDAEPCGRCRKGICTAVECGLTIKLCGHDPEEPPCVDGEWIE